MKNDLYQVLRKILTIFIVLICIQYFHPFSSVFGKDIYIVNRSTGEKISKVETIKAGQIEFVSVTELAGAFKIPYTENVVFKQITLQTYPNPVIITAVNPFIIVGKAIKQMPISIKYSYGTYYAPLVYLIESLKQALPYQIGFDKQKNEIFVHRLYLSVIGIQIEDKKNGTLIRIKLDQEIKTENIFTSESNGWFYVDLYGGHVNTLIKSTVQMNTVTISEANSIQLSQDTARLGFKLLKRVKEKNVSVSEKSNEVLISLRIHEEVPKDLLEALARERDKWKIDVIVIDPGHGGKDPGALGRRGLYEKHAVLAIAKEIRAELQKRLDTKVIMTRDRDTFVPLQERTKIANQSGGKLFISIHADSNPSRRLRGHTVYFMGSAKTEEARRVAQFENSVISYEDSQQKYEGLSDAAFILAANAQNSYNIESQDFGAIVEKEIEKVANSQSQGVRQAGFFVLYGASMPNILIETAFISNTEDERRLKDNSFQKTLARAICNSVIEFKNRYESEI